MKALILAAGYAVRLYPLTKQYPKPLLKVDKKPIINYIIEKLQVIDEIDEIFIVTNSRFISTFAKWANRLKTTKLITLIDDLTTSPDTKRGAIGDMDFSIIEKRIKDDLLVIGGDNLFDGDLKDFLSLAKKKKGNSVIGVYDLKDLSQADKYGVVRLDRSDKIIDFQEKPEKPESTLVAMCLYYFPKSKVGLISEYLRKKSVKSDAMGFYIDWLRKNHSVYGYTFNGYWYDIGDRQFYRKANEKFSKQTSN
jgi:glucose-1-phosphate thymidylyltransferase